MLPKPMRRGVMRPFVRSWGASSTIT
jgi:hypothetical protein